VRPTDREPGGRLQLQTYICTAKAVAQGLCKAEQQGDFLVQGDSTDGTTIVKTRVELDGKSGQNTVSCACRVLGRHGVLRAPSARRSTEPPRTHDADRHCACRLTP
jgi:hypothetical protein